MPRKSSDKRPDQWSHLTDRLASSTPGFLNEVYYGEIYQVKSEPSYGPNNGPSAEVIDKALSPIEVDYRSNKTWWQRAKKTRKCTVVAAIIIHIIFWGFLLVILLMVLGTIKTPFGKPRKSLTPEDAKAPVLNETPIIPTLTNTQVPVMIVFATEEHETEMPLKSVVENVPVGSEIPYSSQQTGFVTLVRTAPSEQQSIHN
ncbi:hypothetical protein N7486_007717 [Penicillium sp. IBT 16267x]|nr:hypothetical protein N7486_007717 [Penicillium sp. IBT 16267x]